MVRGVLKRGCEEVSSTRIKSRSGDSDRSGGCGSAEQENPACLSFSRARLEEDDIEDVLGTETPFDEKTHCPQLLKPICDSEYSCTGCCITLLEHSTDMSYSKHFVPRTYLPTPNSFQIHQVSSVSSSLIKTSVWDVSPRTSLLEVALPLQTLYKSRLFQQSLTINLTRRSSRRKSDPVFKADFHDRMADFRCLLKPAPGPTTTKTSEPRP
jgi:hypothetical protein